MHVHKMVVIESRYAPRRTLSPHDQLVEERQNITIARQACRFAVMQGHNPYASHLFFPQFLNDADPEERDWGIRCGLKWASHAAEAWFILTELGMSNGMNQALIRHHNDNRTIRWFKYEDGEFTEIEPNEAA